MKNMKKVLLSATLFGLVLGLFGAASITNAAVSSVSAGLAQAIVLPASSVTLTGSATASTGSTISGYNWTQISGPVTGVIATPTAASTTVSGLTTAGVYVFKLTASDNTTPTVLTSSSNTTVYVNGSSTVPPVKTFKSKLEINPNGKVNLQGELMSLGAGTMTVKVWGITFTVNTANVKPNGTALVTTDYKVGDSISISGKIDPVATVPTINAKSVRNMTLQANNDWIKKLEVKFKNMVKHDDKNKKKEKHD